MVLKAAWHVDQIRRRWNRSHTTIHLWRSSPIWSKLHLLRENLLVLLFWRWVGFCSMLARHGRIMTQETSIAVSSSPIQSGFEFNRSPSNMGMVVVSLGSVRFLLTTAVVWNILQFGVRQRSQNKINEYDSLHHISPRFIKVDRKTEKGKRRKVSLNNSYDAVSAIYSWKHKVYLML